MDKKPISITIIFNDNILDIPMIHLESTNGYHSSLINKVCEIYNININIFNYIEDLLINNHIIIVSVLNNIEIYIPKTITIKQFENLQSLYSYFLTFDQFEASISNSDNNVFQTITDINAFFEYIENNCIERTRK